VLGRILREHERPEVLDLGPLCGETVMVLADRGARVTVEDFDPPPVLPAARTSDDDGTEGAVAAVAIQQPDARFQLVLAWEHLDFVPPERLVEFGIEIHRVLAPGGFALLFAKDGRSGKRLVQARRCRWRLLPDDRLVGEVVDGPELPRWTYPNREIERALAPLSIQGIHLQRSGMRELLALKAG
jgi:cyclopropane fatty-acyl-phospholipid synthase-like methyltransferase